MAYITIATDISYSHQTGNSTWAFYIRHPGGVIQKVGKFKNKSVHTADMESCALANSLFVLAKEIGDLSSHKIIIYSEVPHIALKPSNKAKHNLRTKAVLNVSLPILKGAGSYELRDIKAHNKDWRSSPRRSAYYMNRWCDKNAVSYRRVLEGKKAKS